MTTDWRERALVALYEAESAGRDEPEVDDLPKRARAAVETIWEHRVALDAELEDAAENWRLARMPAVDRNVLRLGLFELRHRTDTPPGVVISQAVLLAKKYSTERSGSFVNGVLATLSRGPAPREAVGGDH